MTNIKRISTTCLQCNRALYVEDGPICLVCAPAKDPTDARTSYKDVRIKITDIQPDGTPRAEMYVMSLDRWLESKARRKQIAPKATINAQTLNVVAGLDSILYTQVQSISDRRGKAMAKPKAPEIVTLPKRRAFHLA